VKPAEALLGADLVEGWTVTEKLERGPEATGGTFSVQYLAERTDAAGTVEHGFVKALDFSMWKSLGLPLADALNHLTNSYVFERDVVLECAGARMRNVVVGVAAGEYTVDDEAADLMLPDVPYIVFERADGDLRSTMDPNLATFDRAFAFRVLHGVTNGVRQLHQAGVSHQDLKASNVMTFPGSAKVGDLGRASSETGVGINDQFPVAGDPTYAALELLYGELHPDERIRRRASDLYQIGSLAVYLFTGTALTPLVEAAMYDTFHWRNWPKDYRNALTFVREGFDRVMTVLEQNLPDQIRDDVVRVVRELSDPDPLLRGTPSRGAPPHRYALDRYVTHFDRLRLRAEIELRGVV